MARKPDPERVRGRTGRRVGTRAVRQRFLIVCEGEQTEPNYFRAFQVPGLVVTIKDSRERQVVAGRVYFECAHGSLLV